MSSTLVIQSHRAPLPFNWLRACLDSVAYWAAFNHYDYRFVDDALFDSIDPVLLLKLAGQKVIASDLARLKILQQGLLDGYQCVIWCDADFLIFRPSQFVLAESSYALGREVWVQRDKGGRLRAYSKVHNAFLMFRQQNSFLDFYTETAERLLNLNRGSMPPQFIGPKLLSALHNIAHCGVMENAGMLSPMVICDLLLGQGAALDLFRRKSSLPLAGANLGSSLTQAEGFGDAEMENLIGRLLQHGV